MVQAIRNNETSAEVVKKFLSAAAALSERSDSNPVFMMWTIPTTILALMGVVYFAGKLYFYGSHVFRFKALIFLVPYLGYTQSFLFLLVVEGESIRQREACTKCTWTLLT
mgnify:CR=1 FL=1